MKTISPKLQLAALISLLLSFNTAVLAQPKAGEPRLGGAQVTVPWDDFRELIGRARGEPEPAKPPVDFAVAQAAYVGKIEKSAAQFAVTMRVKILNAKGWTLVPIASAKLAVDQVTVDGKAASAVTKDAWHSLLFDAAGEHEIKFTIIAPVAEGAPTQSVAFPIPPSTQTNLELSLPQDELDVMVEGAIDLNAQGAAGKGTRVTARLAAPAQLAVRWQKPLPAPEKREPRITAKVFSLVSVLSDALRVNVAVNYSVLHAAAQRFELLVPDDVTVEEVSGANVHTWTVNRQGKANRVVVVLKDGVRDEFSIRLTLLKPLAADKPVVVPIAEPQGLSEPPRGEVAVETAPQVEIKAADAKNAVKIDTRELAESLLASARCPIGLAYSYARTPQIELGITRHKLVPVLTAMIDLAVYTSTHTLDGLVVTRAQYFIRNNESQYLRVKLPEGARVWSAIVNKQAVKPATDADGLLLVPLVKSRYLNEDELEQRKERKREELDRNRGQLRERRALRQRMLSEEPEEQELKAYPVEIVYAETGKPFQWGGWKTVGARLPQVKLIPIAQVAWAVYLPYELRLDEVRGNIRAVSAFSRFGQDEELLEALWEHKDAEVAQRALEELAKNAAKQLDMQQQLQQGQQQQFEREAGLLPVKVEVPRVGQLRKFEKLMVTPADELHIELDYKLPGALVRP